MSEERISFASLDQQIEAGHATLKAHAKAVQFITRTRANTVTLLSADGLSSGWLLKLIKVS